LQSLSSISIESDSKLKRIESGAFLKTWLTSVTLSGTVHSIAADAFRRSFHISQMLIGVVELALIHWKRQQGNAFGLVGMS
jgi:hypothetical protein